MKVIETLEELHEHVFSDRTIRRALVPTMGALHEGHLSLMALARTAVGEDGEVMVTIFVNPTQFAPHEDFDSYPRELAADLAMCEERGVDVVFTPEKAAMYEDDASVKVVEKTLSAGMCGTSRPIFFSGVCTVVAKLFNLTQPEVAVFGEKDYQQLAIIRRMVRDLNFPIEIIGGQTIRELDGLAMSSRNAYLSQEERKQALILSRVLFSADRETTEESLRDEIESQPLAKVDYIEIVNPDTLERLKKVGDDGAQIAVAAWFGKTRLIDNRRID